MAKQCNFYLNKCSILQLGEVVRVSLQYSVHVSKRQTPSPLLLYYGLSVKLFVVDGLLLLDLIIVVWQRAVDYGCILGIVKT